MSKAMRGALLAIALLSIGAASGATHSIPADKLDATQVYWGSANSFSKPAEVSYEDIIKATPEYAEIKKKKIEPGTGKYWILLSQASERAVQAISEVGDDSDYDLVAGQGYLSTLDPPVAADDVTQLVIDKMNDNSDNGQGAKKTARNTQTEGK